MQARAEGDTRASTTLGHVQDGGVVHHDADWSVSLDHQAVVAGLVHAKEPAPARGESAGRPARVEMEVADVEGGNGPCFRRKAGGGDFQPEATSAGAA